MLDADARDRLVANICDHMSAEKWGVERHIQQRQVGHFRAADKELGDRVAEGLGLNGD